MGDRFLSRGKRIDNGEWVEGFPFLVNDVSYILPHHNTGQPIHVDNLLSTSVEVSKDTICRCTGRTDRDEKLIFEHDVIVFLTHIAQKADMQKQIVPVKFCGMTKQCLFKLQTDYLLKAMRFWVNVVLSATYLTIQSR